MPSKIDPTQLRKNDLHISYKKCKNTFHNAETNKETIDHGNS